MPQEPREIRPIVFYPSVSDSRAANTNMDFRPRPIRADTPEVEAVLDAPKDVTENASYSDLIPGLESVIDATVDTGPPQSPQSENSLLISSSTEKNGLPTLLAAIPTQNSSSQVEQKSLKPQKQK